MSISKAKLFKLHELYKSHQEPHDMLPIGVTFTWRDCRYHILACSCARHFGWYTEATDRHCYNVLQTATSETFNKRLLQQAIPPKYFKYIWAQTNGDPDSPAIKYYTMPTAPAWLAK